MKAVIALFICIYAATVYGRALAPDMPVMRNITAPTETCGGNCPSNDCTTCPCGSDKLMVNIAAACAAFSGWNQAHCQCIVQHESSGNGHAVNHNTNGSNDVGVWQINSVNWGQCNGGSAPCTEGPNRQCAIDVWRWGGNSFKLWSTCGACGAC